MVRPDRRPLSFKSIKQFFTQSKARFEQNFCVIFVMLDFKSFAQFFGQKLGTIQ